MCSHSQASRNSGRRIAGAAAVLAALAATPAGAAERSFDCVIDPSEMVKLGSPVPGILAKVLVRRGDAVTQGQEVAMLNSSIDVAAVNLTRFKAESTARIAAQEARLALAKAKMTLIADLVQRKIEATASNKYEEARAEVRVAEQELVREQQDRKVNQLELARAEAVLEERTIRSPIDGIVTERKLSGGEYINQEGYVVAVARLDPLHVETYLPVATYGQVQVGTVAKVRPNPPIGGSYDATAIVVDRVFDPSSSTYGVRLQLPNPEHALPGGQRCKVAFDMPAG
jgi:RND family efflux transporter MFP subunit